MEIFLENNSVCVYKNLTCQNKSIRDIVDTVVPDVNEDIGKVVSVQHCILLKSKDFTSTGVSVTGVIEMCVLYITENEDKVSNLKLSKNFSIDYDVPGVDSEAIAQIKLKLNNIETKIINPRKIAVSFEILGMLNVFIAEKCEAESFVPEEYCCKLNQKIETVEVCIPCAVCEKTFVLSEQHVLPLTKTQPTRIISANAKIVCGEYQHVGTKLIAKGTATINACYYSNNEDYPVFTEFSINFSQILDTSVENIAHCTLQPEINSIYYDLKESLNGEFVIDIELHAVIQAICCKEYSFKYISDTYSNKMPVINKSKKCSKNNYAIIQQDKISIDEKLSVSDECHDILCVLPSVCNEVIDSNRLTATIHFDIIYQNRTSEVCAVRRSTCGESTELPNGASLIASRLSNIYIKAEDSVVEAKLQLEYSYQCTTEIEYTKVESVELVEEEMYDTAKFPSFTMVKVEEESLWDLAKKYHSSIERICSCNDVSDMSSNFIMIPKEC